MATQLERVLDKLEEIGSDMAVVKSKLPDLSLQISDHEKRLRSLEARLWYGLGVVGILTLAIPLVVEWLVYKK